MSMRRKVRGAAEGDCNKVYSFAREQRDVLPAPAGAALRVAYGKLSRSARIARLALIVLDSRQRKGGVD